MANNNNTKQPGQASEEEVPPMDQGIQVLIEGNEADLDIVAVHGLGVEPMASWDDAYRDTLVNNVKPSFNWLTNDDGLRKKFPHARIMLYKYASAWQKRFRVRQSLAPLASALLSNLNEHRTQCKRRPIIFICHCFGGIVVAKALCIANAKREDYPDLLHSAAGCFFFGTPFKGVELAQFAVYWEMLRTRNFKAGDDYTELLKFLEWQNNDILELRAKFVTMIQGMQPEMSICSVYEVQPINWSRLLKKLTHIKFPDFTSDAINKLRQKGKTCFVEKESAMLFNDDNASFSRTCDHSDLVRFQSNTEREYTTIIGQLTTMIDKAYSIVKARYNQRSPVTDQDFSKLRKLLETGVSMQAKRDMISQTVVAQSFVTGDRNFENWYKMIPGSKRCLWIEGVPSMGKTAASLAAIQKLEEKIDTEQQQNREAVLLAWYFCDSQTDYCTAEDLLKSIILQLVDSKRRLAIYALSFVKTTKAPKKAFGDNRESNVKATMTVEQLWQCLQGMLKDVSLRDVYIVINNLHLLEADSSSTERFIQLISGNVTGLSEDDETCGRWLFTSSNRYRDDLQRCVTESKDIQVIDLGAPEYKNVVNEARVAYAKDLSETLANDKGYDLGLAFEIRDVMIIKAENKKWMDILCLQLTALPRDNRLAIVERLDGLPFGNLNGLIEDTWRSLFNHLDILTNAKLKDVLRALVLVEEAITIRDLSVLTHYSHDELRKLLQACLPLLELSGSGQYAEINFREEELKVQLRRAWGRLLGVSSRILTDAEVTEQIARQHGFMALNCLHFLKEYLESSEKVLEEGEEDASDSDEEPVPHTVSNGNVSDLKTEQTIKLESGAGYQNNIPNSSNPNTSVPDNGVHNKNGVDGDNGDNDEDEDEDDEMWSEYEGTEKPPLFWSWEYPVMSWMYHAKEGGKGAAMSLCKDMKSFWTQKSQLREQWLLAYNAHNDEDDEFAGSSMSALHVTAMLGLTDLTNELLGIEGVHDVNQLDDEGFSPLHFAANDNHVDTLKLLLQYKASAITPKGKITPLHLAARNGHLECMKILMEHPHNADVNAVCPEYGSIICAAILSGVEQAIDILLAHKDIDLRGHNADSSDVPNQNEEEDGNEDDDGEEEDQEPLSLAAKNSADYLTKFLTSEKANWSQEDLDQALWAACDNGRKDSLDVFLRSQHNFQDDWLEECMLVAALLWEWSIVRAILSHRGNGELKCHNIFFLAATGEQEQLDHLAAIWQYAGSSIPKAVTDAALYQAVDYENRNTVLWLLETCHADPNATSEKPEIIDGDCYPEDADDYGNALTAAAFDGNIEMIDILLDHGAVADHPSGAALQMAASRGHEEVIQHLIQGGADKDRILPSELVQKFVHKTSIATALQAACDTGRANIVKLLLDNGANPNLGGGAFSYPILSAIQLDQEEILGHLLDAKLSVDVNVNDGPDGSFPLTYACDIMNIQCIEKLLDHGAHVNAIDSGGDQAIHLAIARGDTQILDLLLKRGAEVTRRSNDRGFPLQYAIVTEHNACATMIADAITDALDRINDAAKHEATSAIRITGKDNSGSDHEQFSEFETLNREVLQENHNLSINLETFKRQVEEENAVHHAEYIRVQEQFSSLKVSHQQLNEQNAALREENDRLVNHLRQIEQQFSKLQGEHQGLKQHLEGVKNSARQDRQPRNYNRELHEHDNGNSTQNGFQGWSTNRGYGFQKERDDGEGEEEEEEEEEEREEEREEDEEKDEDEDDENEEEE